MSSGRRLINVKRPEPLDLPKPEKPKELVTERVTRPDSGQAKLLAQVGQRLTPDSHVYIGSYACHIYKHIFASGEMVYITHTNNVSYIPELVINRSIKELGRKLMTLFGHKPPRKRSDIRDKFES